MGLVVALASWAHPLGYYNPLSYYFSVAELKALDSQFDLRRPLPASSPIVIVAVDEDSFDALDLRWPWPRERHAEFIDIVNRGRPAAIGLDILFAERSLHGQKSKDDADEQKSKDDADEQKSEDDAALAAAIARARSIVLAAAFEKFSDTVTPEGVGFKKEVLNPPLPILREETADCVSPAPRRSGGSKGTPLSPCGFGFANFEHDADAAVRRAMLLRPTEHWVLPSFSLLLLEQAIRGGHLRPPPLPTGEFLINYRGGPRSFPTYSFHRVLSKEIAPETFAGKIVLVGATTPTLHDMFATPFAPQGDMPGVEIHANVLETLILGVPIRPIPSWIVAMLTVAAGAVAVLVARRMRPVPAFAAIAGALAAYLGMSHAVFRVWHLWIGVVTVPLALALGYTGAAVRNFIHEQREKRRLSRFFSPSVVREIVRSHHAGEALESGRRRLTVLFSDIRGFTTLSERLAPEDVVEFLREYLTVMTDAVFKHGGTVDKYIGDAIMALYNVPFEAPDHAAQAVRTALEFQRRLEGLAARFGPRLGAPLRCGVGIHTGDAVVGTLGSEQRLEYTAIGDTVNLGSRLESITKDFDVPIVISEATWMEVKDLFRTRYLGEVTVKGKEVPVKIYTVLDDEDPTRSAASPSP